MGALLSRFVSRFNAKPVDSMHDWPDALRLNAAAATLAPNLYVAFCAVTHGYEPEPWKSLHPAVRRSWVNRAERAIRSIR